MTTTAETTQIYRVYIKATAEAIWEAIVSPEWTKRYGYTGLAEYDLRPGGAYRVRPTDEFRAEAEAQGYPCPDVIIDGEVIEAEAPTKLVTTFRMLMDPEMAEEGFTRITHEINEFQPGVCTLTVTHELAGAPKLAAMIRGDLEAEGAGGGHAWVLSDLKSLLETGKGLAE